MVKNMILSLENVSYKYAVTPILSHVNFVVNENDKWGIVGLNGAGKSTLMRLIAGLSYPSSGEIELFGHTKESKIQVERRRMGCMIESPSINLSMTAKENMRLHRIIRGIPNEEIEDELLKLLDIANTGKKKVKNFSLGMKQRLGIALALVGNPELVILDEPTNGLDPQGIAEIREIIVQLNTEKNITFIISSHILGELSKIATCYGIIEKGELKRQFLKTELTEDLEEYFLSLTGGAAHA